MNKVAKAVVGALVAFGAALVPALSDGAVTTEEFSVLVTAVLGGFGFVWAVPNSVITIAKAVAGAVTAGGAAWLSVYADGAVSGDEWYYVLAAFVGGIAVYQQANEE